MFAGTESFGLWEYPIKDTMIAAMVLPHREIIGRNLRLKPEPPRVFDADLKATHGSLCFLGRPTNCLTMQLQAYLHTLLPRLPKGTEELLREAMVVSCLLSLLQEGCGPCQQTGHGASGYLLSPSLAGPIPSASCSPEPLSQCHSPHHPSADVWLRG